MPTPSPRLEKKTDHDFGATTDELSIRQLNDGLGIFASGSLEAIVTDSSWSAAALGNNVFGDASASGET